MKIQRLSHDAGVQQAIRLVPANASEDAIRQRAERNRVAVEQSCSSPAPVENSDTGSSAFQQPICHRLVPDTRVLAIESRLEPTETVDQAGGRSALFQQFPSHNEFGVHFAMDRLAEIAPSH